MYPFIIWGINQMCRLVANLQNLPDKMMYHFVQDNAFTHFVLLIFFHCSRRKGVCCKANQLVVYFQAFILNLMMILSTLGKTHSPSLMMVRFTLQIHSLGEIALPQKDSTWPTKRCLLRTSTYWELNGSFLWELPTSGTAFPLRQEWPSGIW